MKLAVLLLASLFLAACQTTPGKTATHIDEPRGVPLGDSNVRVSGYTQFGGSISR